MKTARIISAFALTALFFTGCGKDPKIDKEYNPVFINVAGSSLIGTFKQGDEVSGAKIILKYENGLGRAAQALVPAVNGVYGAPVDLTLAARNTEDNGSGTIEIPLSGVPEAGGTMKLRPTIRLNTHDVFIEFTATVAADIILDAAGSSAVGTYKLDQPLSNCKIVLAYTATQAQDVKIRVDNVVGISAAEYSATMPAAPNGGTIDVPLTGTPTDFGSKTLTVVVTKGTIEYKANVTVNIVGDIVLDGTASVVTGDLFKNEAITDAKIALKYTSEEPLHVTIEVPEKDGISVAPFTTDLPAGTVLTVDLPLTGTPTSDGVKAMTVNVKIGDLTYTATVNVTVVAKTGIPFVQETLTFNLLEYKTVFVDINGNGYVDPGDVWLDRNIGATSTDPGIYGAGTFNPLAIGLRIQWGRPYGSLFDAAYAIDFDATSPWSTICPTGYELPSLEQFRDAIKKLTGGTVSGNNVNIAGINQLMMNSVLKLPMNGWITGAQDNPLQQGGEGGAYWTSTKGSNTAPWKVGFASNNTGSTSGWADKGWLCSVRCIKTIAVD